MSGPKQYSFPPTRKQIIGFAGLAVAALPVVVFSLMLSRHLANIPLWDDYPSVLAFACDWRDASGWNERLSLLFSQYFSHRIVLTRLCVLATLGLTGQVNFLWLQVFGWVAWIGLFALLARRWRGESRSWWLLVPIACLLMQPQAFSNHLIGMQAVQNIGVLLWAFLAVDLASRTSTTPFVCAAALAATAPFVSANGLLVAPAVLLLLAATGRWRRAGLVLVLGLLTWAVYFTGYANPQTPFNVGEFIDNAATMAGAPVVVLTLGKGEARVAGLLLLGLAGVLLARPDTWRTTPVAAAWLVFIILSILMAARGRIGWGSLYMLQDRYRVYGMLLLALLYWQLARLWVPRAPRLLAVAGGSLAAFFCLLSYQSWWPILANEAASARVTAINRQLGHWAPEISGNDWAASARLLARAENAGIYRLPAVLPPATIAWLREPPAAAAVGTISVRPYADGFNLLISPGAGQARPAFGLLAGGVSRATPLVLTRSRLADLFRHGRFTGPTYSFLLPAPARPSLAVPFLAVGLVRPGEPAALWQAAPGAL